MDKWLNLAEKWLKTDVRYMLRGSFWVSMGHVVSSLSGLALSLTFANLIPQETYGIYKYVLSLAGILTIPTLFGIDQAVLQAITRGDEGTFFEGYKTKLRWGTLAGVASLSTAGYYFYQGNSELGIALLIAAVFLPVMDVLNLYGSILQGKKDFGRNYGFFMITQVVSVTSLIATLFLTKNIQIILIAYFLPLTLTRYIFLKITLNKYQLNNQVDGSAIGYGKHLSLMGVLGMIAAQADKILVFQFVGAKELAIYSFAVALPEQIRSLSKGIFNVGFPKLAELRGAKLRQSLAQKTKILTALSVFIVLGYMLTCGYVFKWFFPKYLESIWYSRLFMVGFLAVPGITVLGAYFNIEKKIKDLYYLNVLSGISAIILSLIMIKTWGLLGAILKNTIWWIILLLLNYSFLVKETWKNKESV